MRSIKEQRELMHMAERGLVPFYMITVSHAELLDWAERIKKEVRCDSSAEIDINALLKIIEELPEE